MSSKTAYIIYITLTATTTFVLRNLQITVNHQKCMMQKKREQKVQQSKTHKIKTYKSVKGLPLALYITRIHHYKESSKMSEFVCRHVKGDFFMGVFFPPIQSVSSKGIMCQSRVKNICTVKTDLLV